MPLAIIDNFDSFTFNLIELLARFGVPYEILKNDKITARSLRSYDRVIISPGPGTPSEAGNLKEVLHSIASELPILGICLGHQALAENFGGKLIQLAHPLHGVRAIATIHDREDPLFRGLPSQIDVGLYHSWRICPTSLSDELLVTATDNEGNILAIRHRHYPVFGIQFHPESIMTPFGPQILQNWLMTA